jgi:hydroxyacylglutathione hydrolase
VKKFLSAVLVLIVLALVGAITERHRLLVTLLATDAPPGLLPPADEGDQVTWHDDYFTVQAIDAMTFAIGEPRYHQQNFNYLIIGTERAILFDAGPGYRDIREVVGTLTTLPVTFIPSHFHFDHIGNGIDFERRAVVDLPHLRERATGNELRLTWQEHLGSAEGYALPVVDVDEWITPNEVIALGGRELVVLYTPGHTDDSISLVDLSGGYVFSGDFIYPGPLFAFLPNSSMGDYLQGADTLLSLTTREMRVFGAHRASPPGAPVQAMVDIEDLREALLSVQAGNLDGEGVYPVSYIVSPTIQLLAEPAWLQNWGSRYPELKRERR